MRELGHKLDLRDRVVVVTGGARGIGLAVASAAAARGAIPALLDVDGDEARGAAARLGPGAVGVQADVADEAAVDAAIAGVVGRLGGIDVLVANAGIGPRTTTVDAGDRAHQRRVLDVNLHGVWHTMWAGAGHVAERRGHIVVVSSIAAFVLTPGWAAYAASKAAVEQLARSMRVELAPAGATVGVAHFGLVDTALVREFRSETVASRMEALMPRALSATVTADSAGEALVRGIERRSARTIHPSRWSAAYALRGLLGPGMDAVAVRDPRIRALMSETREQDRMTTADRA